MRSVFISVAAYLGRIRTETRCAFWTDEPPDHEFDESRLIEIDLARNPQNAASGEIAWEEVQVDDCIAGPGGNLLGTTLGSQWPELQLTGIVGLEQRFWASLPDAIRPANPPAGAHGRDYELMTAVYWPDQNDPRSGNRYAGHHAKILEERGGLARVAVFPPTASLRPTAEPAKMWIDLANPDQCDAGRDSLTRIGVGDAPKEGALFLIMGRLQT